MRFNERSVLPNLGGVSRETADEKAVSEYERFEARRREHLEAQAEAELHQLEDATKHLPRPPEP